LRFDKNKPTELGYNDCITIKGIPEEVHNWESGILRPIRLRIFFKLKRSSSAIPLYGGIGRSRGGVNPPVVVRHLTEGVNPPEASHL